MAKIKTPCERDGHDFVMLREYRQTRGPDTIIFSVFYCRKCCETSTKETGVWKDFVAHQGWKKQS